MNTRTIVEYILAALIVMMLGALAGWYFFLRGQTQTTVATDTARGLSSAPSFSGTPSGTGNAYQNIISGVAGVLTGKNPAPAAQKMQLWEVDATPVAGMGFVQGTTTPLYFIERAGGYVFAADAAAQTIARLSNTLMPKIYEASVNKTGRVLERSIDASGNLTTFSGMVASATTSTSAPALSGLYLARNIARIAQSPSSDEVFYLTADPTGIAGIRAKSDGTKQKKLFSSSIASWDILWLADGRIILLEAPADGMPGFAYELKSDGALASLVGPLPGLTITPRPSSQALLYGISAGGSTALFAQIDQKTTPVLLPIRTIADKCVWAPDPVGSTATAGVSNKGAALNGAGKALIAYCAVPASIPVGNFLDDWYRGALHTSDAWWKVDASAGTAQLLYSPNQNVSLDVENPMMDGSGTYLAFQNRADKSLWILNVNQ